MFLKYNCKISIVYYLLVLVVGQYSTAVPQNFKGISVALAQTLKEVRL